MVAMWVGPIAGWLAQVASSQPASAMCLPVWKLEEDPCHSVQISHTQTYHVPTYLHARGRVSPGRDFDIFAFAPPLLLPIHISRCVAEPGQVRPRCQSWRRCWPLRLSR